MRFLLKSLALLIGAALLSAAAVLAWGHVQIRGITPELPEPRQILEPDRSPELPVRLTWINTASQRMPRSAVLDPDRDPQPRASYVMSHPAFVIEWQDGRVFLVDLGLEVRSAVDFGLPLEMLAGASPIEPHAAASEALGDDRKRVAGVGFTHLHADHTAGLDRLCADLGARGQGSGPIALFQAPDQIGSVNHTTYGPRAAVRAADCVELRPLAGERGLLPVPDFPGLYAVPVGGHTPGSTMWVVQLRVAPGGSRGYHDDVQTWVITGDVVNHVQGVELGLSKPAPYSWLVVPEDDLRLGRVRVFLKELSRAPGLRLLVNHDRNQIEATGLPAY